MLTNPIRSQSTITIIVTIVTLQSIHIVDDYRLLKIIIVYIYRLFIDIPNSLPPEDSSTAVSLRKGMRPDAPYPSTQTSTREGWDAMDAMDAMCFPGTQMRLKGKHAEKTKKTTWFMLEKKHDLSTTSVLSLEFARCLSALTLWYGPQTNPLTVTWDHHPIGWLEPSFFESNQKKNHTDSLHIKVS
jgi:hypothetical protein